MQFAVRNALSLLFLLCLAGPAFGQLKSGEIDNSDVVVKIYRSEAVQTAHRAVERDDYNAGTIHKKVAQYGLAGSMAATFVGSLAMDDEFFETTVIPVVGPFVTMVRVESDPDIFYRPGGRPLLIASGVTQSAFLTYLVVAWIGETSYEAQHQSGLSVIPASSRGGTGVSLRYRF